MPLRIDPAGTEVSSALERLQADPNLAAERTIRVLKWAEADEAPSKPGAWVKWLGELFGWLAQSGRVLLWVVAGVLAALLVLYIYRLVRGYRANRSRADVTTPSHVGELDIRPETLPADIGAAAFDLWQRGEHRAALALLYRGLLSRLVHVHGVPIRDSSTEGDCLTLAARHLSLERAAYSAQLIRVWQHAVYGGCVPESATVADICRGFAAALDPAPTLELLAQPA